MKEFFLIVRNLIDHQKDWPPDKTADFLNRCEAYIKTIQKEGKMLSARPLVREGIILSKTGDTWKTEALGGPGAVQVGYYHVMARDLDDAAEIARGNPEFDFGESASIEIRPVKVKEESTGFGYPNSPKKPKPRTLYSQRT